MDAAEKIREEAKTCDHLRVYACGGDGTFNECVCGAALLPNVAVCPFPTGTGNDFCRMFGEEKDCFRDLDALLAGSVHPIDLIDCNGRYSVNICSVGIDARIGSEVHKYSGLPADRRRLRLCRLGCSERVQGHQPQHACPLWRVSAPEGGHALIAACNGRFYGGGFNPSLHARPDDGVLDFYIVPR